MASTSKAAAAATATTARATADVKGNKGGRECFSVTSRRAQRRAIASIESSENKPKKRRQSSSSGGRRKDRCPPRRRLRLQRRPTTREGRLPRKGAAPVVPRSSRTSFWTRAGGLPPGVKSRNSQQCAPSKSSLMSRPIVPAYPIVRLSAVGRTRLSATCTTLHVLRTCRFLY